tara:strand:- start:237 stop:1274 length:1038 start_codon:yes stop_codon:yes gene_type:complete
MEISRYNYTSKRHTTSYLSCGPKDGDLIVMMHGWPDLSISWEAQLKFFGAKGFHAVAPDMRGYGQSSIHNKKNDYCMKEIVADMTELLSGLGQKEAIWIGHDWGSPVAWNIALHEPDKVKGIVSLCVPFGWGGHPKSYLSTVNRNTYPIDEYPYGQWDYMFFYLDNFELVLKQMEEDIKKFLAITFRRPSDETISMFNTAKGYKSPTALITKNGGWFRQNGYQGLKSMPEIKFDKQILSNEKSQFYIDTFLKNGLRGPNSWYMNGSKNDDYAQELGGFTPITKPVLFIAGENDSVLTPETNSHNAMVCTNLTEKSLQTGHWMAMEKPVEVNTTIYSWINENFIKL